MASLIQLCHVMSNANCTGFACCVMHYSGVSGAIGGSFTWEALFCYNCMESLVYRDSVRLHSLEWI